MAGIPDALRVGTPASERGDNPYRNFPQQPRRTSSSSSKVSELFSSRRSSEANSDVSPIAPSSRYSYSSVASLEPQTYTSPAAPPLPALQDYSSYEPFSPFEPQGATPSFKRNRSLISKLGSIRSARLSRKTRYGVLNDDDEERGPARLGNLEEEDGEHIGIDLSGFDGNFVLNDFAKKTDSAVGERELRHATPASLIPGRIGGGMGQIMTAAVIDDPKRKGHRRGESLQDQETRRNAQKLAEARGEILAVEAVEGPAVDISNLGGADYQRRDTMASLVSNNGENKKSFFFPDDPEMPKWRPLSMRWPYISTLVAIAIALAALQEFLCQLSLRRAAHDDGLIKFYAPQQIPTMTFFAWKYLPTMLLVTYGVMWQVTDYECKRLEPYYQLSKRSGATAATSLNLDYLTFMSYLIPIRAVINKQWAVVYSSIATLMAGGLLAVLQSASVTMEPELKFRKDNEPKFVRINPIWSRFLEGTLICIAFYGVLLIIQLRRKSGLISDPKGIAGIAAMATKSHILNDFKGLDTAPNHIIHQQLRSRRYNLHKSSLWQGEYIRNDEKIHASGKENPHPVMMRLTAGIPYILYIAAFAAIVPTFMFVGSANGVLEKVPWLLTLGATVVKLMWNCLDINLRVIEPYYILSRRHAPPRTLTLDYTGTVPGYLSFKAALNGHWLVALVSFGAIMAEVLTVCVTSFSVDGRSFISGHGDDGKDGNGGDHNMPASDRYNTSETFRSLWISYAIANGVLIYLIVVASLLYTQRRHKFLPRQPGTIAGVMAYIHQSRMLDDFIDTEGLNSLEMTKHLEKLGKTYALGWFRGRDGEDHCGVDQEPILAPYRHGKDWTAGRLQTGQIGTWEYF
jgi:Protein of unknown function (DUF3433)